MNRFRIYPKKMFWRIYVIALVVSLVLDLIWLYRKILHYHFGFQYLPQFFALFGLVGCMLVILIAKAMGWFLVVDEDYYDNQERGQGD